MIVCSRQIFFTSQGINPGLFIAKAITITTFGLARFSAKSFNLHACTISKNVVLHLLLLVFIGVQGQRDSQILLRLHIREDYCVLTGHRCVEKKDTLGGTLALVKDLTIRVIDNARDGLLWIAPENIVGTFDG